MCYCVTVLSVPSLLSPSVCDELQEADLITSDERSRLVYPHDVVEVQSRKSPEVLTKTAVVLRRHRLPSIASLLTSKQTLPPIHCPTVCTPHPLPYCVPPHSLPYCVPPHPLPYCVPPHPLPYSVPPTSIALLCAPPSIALLCAPPSIALLCAPSHPLPYCVSLIHCPTVCPPIHCPTVCPPIHCPTLCPLHPLPYCVSLIHCPTVCPPIHCPTVCPPIHCPTVCPLPSIALLCVPHPCACSVEPSCKGHMKTSIIIVSFPHPLLGHSESVPEPHCLPTWPPEALACTHQTGPLLWVVFCRNGGSG